MDLPKNITQIGVQDANCKVYVEDYVVSFLKQLNPIARDKTMAAALYGRRKVEGDKTYLFVYGAGKLDFIQKEARHLSQAQRQEIERIRRQYFGDYEFLGYRILNGEMVEGFYVCEQDICRYVAGYAQFYENNEAMLTYMLESRQGDAAPESVDSEKYEMVRDRQEKRRAKFTQHKMEQEKEKAPRKFMTQAQKRGFQAAAATMFVLLFLLGITLHTPLLENGSMEWEKLKAEFSEKKLSGAMEGNAEESEPTKESATIQERKTEIIKADDKLTEALQAENRQKDVIPVSGKVATDASAEQKESQEASVGESTEAVNGQATGVTEEAMLKETTEETAEETMEEVADASMKEAESQSEEIQESSEEEPRPRAYIVCQGDTLTGISLQVYGTGNYVNQICQLNQIKNPDEIQIGQKILLP